MIFMALRKPVIAAGFRSMSKKCYGTVCSVPGAGAADKKTDKIPFAVPFHV